MKRQYIQPEFEKITFNIADVIASSDNSDIDNRGDDFSGFEGDFEDWNFDE